MKKTLLNAFYIGTLVTAVSTANAASLGMGAGTQGSQNYSANSSVAKFLSDEAGMDIRVQSYGGSGQSMPLIDAGRLDLQLVPSPEALSAATGKEPFEGRPMQNLRLVASMSSSAYGFMVKKDSDLYKVSDIRGRSLTYGYSAQPTLRLQVDGILAAGGLSIKDVESHVVPAVPNGVDDFISGSVDVAFFSLNGGKTREAEAAVGIRWLAVNDTPEAEAAMQELVPSSYIQTVQPSATAVGVSKPTPLMHYNYYMIAGAHVPDETIYEILKTLHSNADKVRASFKTFADFAPEAMAPKLKGGMSYHAGAIKFYKEVGLME